MLDDVAPLVEAGFAVHWLRAKSKAPFKDAWSTEPVYSIEDLKAAYRPGYNVGLRLGEPSRVAGHYLHVIDLDIRDNSKGDEARAALRTFLPDYDALPFVISGSGGQSRHFYFLTEQPFRSKKLAHSAEKITGADGKQHWAYEIEIFGTGKQVAMPPSIHPDTGKPYVWGRRLDFEDLDLGVGPFVSAERVATWAPTAVAGSFDEDDDLASLVAARPMGLSRKEIDDCLAALPLDAFCEDREGWLTVGMALHHEFEGSADGLAVWNAFSKQSPKFDAKDQARVWESFRSKQGSTRMATLIKAAAVAKFAAEDEGVDDVDTLEDDLRGGDDEDDDLIGDLEETATVREAVPWKQLLDLNEEAAIKPTLHNMELIVTNDARTAGLVKYNNFTQEVTLRGKPGTTKHGPKRAKPARQLTGSIWDVADPVNGDMWSSRHDWSVRSIFEAPKSQGGYGLKITDRDLKAAVNLSASAHDFHPVREYLESLAWDGVPRLDDLFIKYLGAEPTAYSRSIARLTLTGAVVRVYEPGHKFDFALILEGIQGKRKSTFISILARHWFSEIEGDFEDRKAMVEKMQGAWILELPELQGFGRSEISTLKAFISCQTDKVRLAYEPRAKEYKRQSILVGSTNDRRYLRDDTGGRRFWPLACTVDEIDTDGLLGEIDQVWAEALVGYRAMREAQPFGTLPLYITDEDARAEALEKQEERRIENSDDVLAGAIAAWLDRPLKDESGFDDEDDRDLMDPPPVRNLTCCAEIWCEMMRRDLSQYSAVQQQQIGRAMSKVDGWYPAGQMRTEKFGKQRIFRRFGAPVI